MVCDISGGEIVQRSIRRNSGKKGFQIDFFFANKSSTTRHIHVHFYTLALGLFVLSSEIIAVGVASAKCNREHIRH